MDERPAHDSPAKRVKNGETMVEKVRQIITPSWNIPIEIQLKQKQNNAERMLLDLKHSVINANPAADNWIGYQESKNRSGMFIEFNCVLKSPKTEGYRNKCEFVIGINPENDQPTIGFVIEEGTSKVGPIEHLKNISDPMKSMVKDLELYVRQSQVPTFDVTSGNGHWMGVVFRQTRANQTMLNVSFHPQDLTKLQLKAVKEKLKSHFGSKVTSLYFTERKQWESGTPENLLGMERLTEELLGKKFQISPQSYFAVNTSAAEVLYNAVSELVQLNLSCTLVDICCGTGSIGLSLSDRCGQVIGIDILEEAIEDARNNALANDVTNCEFFVGSAEDNLHNVWKRIAFSEAICVIDPPRAGIGTKAIQSIRRNGAVTKVIYVASDPQAAMKNFADLARVPSNMFKGDPFIPIKIAPVDMYPHTSNFTVAVLFLRLKMCDIVNPENVNVDTYNTDNSSRSRRPKSTLPEAKSYSQPPPDLRWKPVKEDLAMLSKDQIAWLDQMTQVYGNQFERRQWIETFERQNKEASDKYYANLNQWYPSQPNFSQPPPPTPVPPPPAKPVPSPVPAPGGGHEQTAWKEYAKQMAQYWSQVAGPSQTSTASAMSRPPPPPPPLPKS